MPARQLFPPARTRVAPRSTGAAQHRAHPSPPDAGGTYANLACSNGATPACESPLLYYASYDVCIKSFSEPVCPQATHTVNATARPLACSPYCPSGTGIKQSATSSGSTVSYCALVEVGYDLAAAARPCVPPAPPPPPAPPTRVCSVPPRITLPGRKCPNGGAPSQRLPAPLAAAGLLASRSERQAGT
jgi:hypothetical protein